MHALNLLDPTIDQKNKHALYLPDTAIDQKIGHVLILWLTTHEI